MKLQSTKTPIARVIAGTTVLFLSPILAAHEAGDMIVRLGAAMVEPDESSSLVTTAATGALAGTSVGVGNNTQLGINFVYMVTDAVAVEVLAATPFKHDLTVSGLAQYGFQTTDLGDTKHLPPTVSALYYFGSSDSTVRPYLGGGLNYTTFFSQSLSSQARTELAATSLDIDDSFGLSLRAGFDWQLNEKWLLNASVWNIDIDADASFDSALGRVNATVDIDPWVYMVSLGYKF